MNMDTQEQNYRDKRNGKWTNEVYTIPLVLEQVPNNINELDRLWINIGPISDLAEKERKIAKKEWIKILPTLSAIKYLWVKGNVNQEFFDAICQLKNLECLYLSWTSVKNLDRIRNLNNLIHLYIGSSSKIQELIGLDTLSELLTLELEGIKLVNDISPVTKLKNLRGLYIHGDMWKKQFIQSLNGIENLNNLEYLSIDGTEIIEKNITPITKLTKLKNLELGYWWTAEDLQLVYKSIPSLQYGSVKEAVESGEFDKYLRKVK